MQAAAKRRRRSTESKAPYFCCRTCRTRRIKCDGARPLCKNCTKQGHICRGYSSWDVSLDIHAAASVQEESIVPASVPVTQPTSPAPVFSVPASPLVSTHIITDEARHAFDYFRYRICARFVERGYPILWATSSISVGLQEPAVFYAIAALSTAEQSLVHTVHTTLTRPVDERKKSFALEMYSEAISCLRGPMQRAMQGNGPLEAIILSCVLFLVFEATMGNNLNALKHGRIGKSILDERLRRDENFGRALSAPSSSSSPDTPSELTRSESSFDRTSPPPSLQIRNPDAGMSFISLAEARSYLEILMEAGHSIREQLLTEAQKFGRNINNTVDTAGRFCLSNTISRTMPIPLDVQTRLNDIIKAFASWGQKFGLMFQSEIFLSQDLFYMQIRFFYASFTLAMCRASHEKLADVFADQFSRTLDSAERLLRQRPLVYQWGLEETTTGPIVIDLMRKLSIADGRGVSDMDEGPTGQPQVGPMPASEVLEDRAAGVFEFGVLPALFTISCKCRNSAVRRRAVQLLFNAKRAEAVNSSRTLSRYAEAIVYLEEQQAAQLIGEHVNAAEFYADEVPEHVRFLDVVCQPILEKPGSFALVCTKRVHQDGSDVELLTFECSGIAPRDCRLVSGIVMPEVELFSEQERAV